jgi:uncharacterized peroxidase-related enzyme
VVHHRRGLRQLLKNDALVVAVENDWTTAALGDKRRAMLAFAVKLTITPGAITPDDAQALRDTDFSDRDILDITEVVAYYAYANRIADGLGIETETWIT